MSTKKINHDPTLFSPAQCRAARALLDWSQETLATKARVGRSTVTSFERGLRTPVANNLVAMQEVLEQAGIEFIHENGSAFGVQLKKK